VAKELIARRMIDGVEALRAVKAQLPIGTYLQLLHVAAVTGRLPKLDPWTFKPVTDLAGNEVYNEVDVSDRLKILGGLVDKVVPDAKVSETPQGSHDPAILLKQDLSKLPREALLGIISQAGAALEAPAAEPE
jgi:hypothetical protein